jgi:hypothetical protein
MTAPAQHTRRWAALLLGALLLITAGCSVRRLAYQWAPRLLLGIIDDAVDLRREQKELVRGRLREHLAWHRREELPVYASRVEELRTRIARGMTPEDLRWLRTTSDGLLRRLGERLLGDTAHFLATLSPEQVSHLERELEKRNRKRYEHYDLPPDRYAQKRTDELNKSVSRWMGHLTPGQRELCLAWFRRAREDALLRRQAVVRHQRDFLQHLRQGVPAETLAREVLARLLRDDAYLSPEERAATRRLDDQAGALALEVLRQATPAQLRHLDSELAELRDDLLALARDPQ